MNQVSLLNKKISEAQTDKKACNFKVYIEDSEGNSYSTKLSEEVNTIEEAIVQSIKNFNKTLMRNFLKTHKCMNFMLRRTAKKTQDCLPFRKRNAFLR